MLKPIADNSRKLPNHIIGRTLTDTKARLSRLSFKLGLALQRGEFMASMTL